MHAVRFLRRPTILLILSSALVMSNASTVRSEKKELSLDDVRAPTSPAFILLGVAPASVERPQTARAAAVSLLSALGQNDFIPDNFAIEFAPYSWLPQADKPLDTATFERAGGQTILENLAISMATSRSEGSDTTGTIDRIAVGFRTLFLAGNRDTLITNHQEYVTLFYLGVLCDAARGLVRRRNTWTTALCEAQGLRLHKEIVACRDKHYTHTISWGEVELTLTFRMPSVAWKPRPSDCIKLFLGQGVPCGMISRRTIFPRS
jgi:hypothetical protein